eukprot:14460800-Ditylum_brightwellii.AAC.1
MADTKGWCMLLLAICQYSPYMCKNEHSTDNEEQNIILNFVCKDEGRFLSSKMSQDLPCRYSDKTNM